MVLVSRKLDRWFDIMGGREQCVHNSIDLLACLASTGEKCTFDVTRQTRDGKLERVVRAVVVRVAWWSWLSHRNTES